MNAFTDTSTLVVGTRQNKIRKCSGEKFRRIERQIYSKFANQITKEITKERIVILYHIIQTA